MSYSEFPHTLYGNDCDHIELIRLYKELVADYSGTLEEINSVTERLNDYVRDMNAQISNITNTVVPAAVDRAVRESISQYQSEMNTRINNLVNRVSTVENMYDSIQADIASASNNLQSEIDRLRAELMGADNTLQTQINNFNRRVDNLSQRISQFESNTEKQLEDMRRNLYDAIDESADEMEYNIGVAFDNLSERISTVENESKLRDMSVLNQSKAYTDDKVSSLHTLIENLDAAEQARKLLWLWQYGCNFGGYNAIQWYNEPMISCEDWNDSEITCVDWYVRGREVFHWFGRRNRMFSPVSGRYVDVKEALLELATALKINGITAGDYEQLGFTAREYENFREQAGDYDWNGRVLS